jgi:UTP--glucose-1-phosphate uridylyltransferase
MKPVRKAVITAAGRGTRQYPASSTVQKEMFPLVDRDGLTKPVIQIIAEEAVNAGIGEICIVVSPGDEEQYRRHFRGISEDLLPHFRGKQWALEESAKLAHLQRIISFVVQETPEGYGHAVHCARDFVGDEPFLLLLGDHVYVSGAAKNCARQVIDAYGACGCAVSAVKRTPEYLLHLFGTVTGRRVASDPDMYEVTDMMEKPSVEEAEARLRTEGLRRGTYLCFFGMHVFTPGLFDCLEHHIRRNIRQRSEIQLTTAQKMLSERERYVAFEAVGERYDMGVPFGLVETQIALALNSPARDEMLASLVSIIARSGMSRADREIWR